MDLTEISDFLKIINELPPGWKITFIFIFFALPKLLQIIGGGKVLRAGIAKFWEFVVAVMTRYQARKARQMEDQALTEAYTRTLVVESLGLFSERIKRMDHKINFIVLVLDPDAIIEQVEDQIPKRYLTDTIAHNRLHERLAQIRRQNESRKG